MLWLCLRDSSTVWMKRSQGVAVFLHAGAERVRADQHEMLGQAAVFQLVEQVHHQRRHAPPAFTAVLSR